MGDEVLLGGYQVIYGGCQGDGTATQKIFRL